jgi:Bacterial SH3 domain
MQFLKRGPIAHVIFLLLILLSSLSGFSQTATLKRNSNLRKSASSSSAVVELLSAGDEVTLVSNHKQSGYYHVEAKDGEKGWVLARNLGVSAPSSPSGTNTTSASLLAQLKAARVTAVPQPLVIGGHEVCPATGNSTDTNMTELNKRKNRTDIPDASAYIPIDWEVLKGLPSNSPDDLQGAPVMVTGFLSHRIKVENGSPGESTNCKLLNDDEVDWHIYLTKAASQPISKAVIVETTPRTRPLHTWDKAVLDGLVNKDQQVRISGWLMYDFQHVSEIGTARATVWEVHPITRIEVSDGSGGWNDIEHH